MYFIYYACESLYIILVPVLSPFTRTQFCCSLQDKFNIGFYNILGESFLPYGFSIIFLKEKKLSTQVIFITFLRPSTIFLSRKKIFCQSYVLNNLGAASKYLIYLIMGFFLGMCYHQAFLLKTPQSGRQM